MGIFEKQAVSWFKILGKTEKVLRVGNCFAKYGISTVQEKNSTYWK